MKRSLPPTLILLLFAAFLLRIWQISSQSLSGDEAFTATQWGTASLPRLFTEIATKDPQPPVSLLTFRIWIQLAGSSEFSLRIISAFFSLITVAALYALLTRITRPSTALLGALFCTIAPFQIWHAQDARPYAEWMALTLLASTAFLHALPHKSMRQWIPYIVLQALSLQAFYLEVFVLAATNLFAVFYFLKRRALNTTWLVSQLLVAATFVPWLLYSKPQNSPYQPTAGLPNIPAALTDLLLNTTLPANLTPALPDSPVIILHVVIITGIVIAIAQILCSRLPVQKYHLIFQVIVPITLLTALSIITQKGFFRTRYIASTSAPLLGIIAAAALANHRHIAAKLQTYVVALIILPLSIVSILAYRWDPQFLKAPPWRDIAAILETNATADDIVIQNYPDPALTYYFSGPAPTVILPSGENPPVAETIAQLEPIPETHDHLWFIRVDTPFWDRDQVVANWLDSNTAYLTDTWVGGMRIYQYGSWESATALAHDNLQTSIDIATLHGSRLTQTPPNTSRPTRLTLELFWEPRQTTDADLTTFVHLITIAADGSVQLIAQDDHPIQQGRLSTTHWPIGIILRDVYQLALPLDIADGSYILTTGFYDPITLQRHTIPVTVAQQEPNAITISTITIPFEK